MVAFMAFLSEFCSYLLLLGIIVVLIVAAVFIGIRLRKNKDMKDAAAASDIQQ
jgi:hypothetical protein